MKATCPKGKIHSIVIRRGEHAYVLRVREGDSRAAVSKMVAKFVRDRRLNFGWGDMGRFLFKLRRSMGGKNLLS